VRKSLKPSKSVDTIRGHTTHLVSLIDSVRDKVIALGLLDEKALADHRAALMQHLEKPETVVIDKLFVQAWGQKPS
jgi:hypothetical protein